MTRFRIEYVDETSCVSVFFGRYPLSSGVGHIRCGTYATLMLLQIYAIPYDIYYWSKGSDLMLLGNYIKLVKILMNSYFL